MRRRLVIATGGTAGHVTAGLAIAEQYRSSFAGLDLFFVGRPASIEEELVVSSGYRFEGIDARPYARQGIFGKSLFVASSIYGTARARQLLRKHDRKLVIGLGGYVSAGAVLAAYSLGISTIVHEANVVPGKANLLLGRFADRVLLGWTDSEGTFPPHKTVVTGNPLRRKILNLGSGARSPVPRASSIDEPYRILVTGGSEGSSFLNREAAGLLRSLATLGTPLAIRHQTGLANRDNVRLAYQNADLDAQVEQFCESMSEIYEWAEFVITAGGALTLAELAFVGLPALVVPSSAVSDDHQTANAIAFTECGGNFWTSESRWDTSALANQIAGRLSVFDCPQEHAPASGWEQPQEAGARIVEECERIMKSRWEKP